MRCILWISTRDILLFRDYVALEIVLTPLTCNAKATGCPGVIDAELFAFFGEGVHPSFFVGGHRRKGQISQPLHLLPHRGHDTED